MKLKPQIKISFSQLFTMDKFSQELELELYTIPSHSSWFSWINIHEVERISLREFFDGSSITRSPRIYKEYRDFIISKFRENPSRKLTFTQVRKSLVGDISVLLKVFTFLEKWGLINYNVGEKASNGEENEEEQVFKGKVKMEEGAPYGVRVVAAPNSMKPLVPPPAVVDGGVVKEDGFKWPPLASYSDVYGELMEQEKKKVGCGSCKENCGLAYYEYEKEGELILCEKCFSSGNYDKNKFIDEFKLTNSTKEGAVWTEAETLLLLESVIKHGDEWDLVSKNVPTKSKLDCISKLMQLPFGDLMLGAVQRNSKKLDKVDDVTDSNQADIASTEPQEPTNQAEVASTEPQESLNREDQNNELMDTDQQSGEAENENSPRKKMCTRSTSDIGGSLMEQVARISGMLGPQVTGSAAEAAVTALCHENQCVREMFEDPDSYDDPSAPPETADENRAMDVDNAVEDESPNHSEMKGKSSLENIIPQNLRTRAATATALGAAAANAKLLADQEEREMAHLVANIIEAQVKKVRQKMKYFEDLEVIMEKEHAQLEKLEESLVSERLEVLERVITSRINKPRDHTIAKYPTE